MDDEDFYDEFGNYIGPEETSYAQMDGPRGRSPSPLRYDQPEAMEVEHQPTTAPSDGTKFTIITIVKSHIVNA